MSHIVPQAPRLYSNNDWRKLGERIRLNPENNIFEDDIKMLQDLRVTYKEPLAHIFSQLEKIAKKVDKGCICTYRVKRIDSIISKMKRIPGMVINRAEDIAGCRCIVHSVTQVYAIYNRLVKLAEKMNIEIKPGGHDYIKNPKEGGYKSLHVIVAMKGDSRRVEIQIRTTAQHNWATLVEISDLLFDSKIKEHGKEKTPDLFNFHLLLSKDNMHLSKSEKLQISEIAMRYNYIEKLSTIFQKNYIDVRTMWNKSGIQKKHFFLISIDSSAIPEFEGFTYFDEAEDAYFEKYISNRTNKNIVLTHLDRISFGKICMAYSNYMLTYNSMIVRILGILSESVIDNYHLYSLSRFKKLYSYFLDMITIWATNQAMDIDSLNKDPKAKQSASLKEEWVNAIISNVGVLNKILGYTQFKLRYRILTTIPYLSMKRLFNRFKRTLTNK